MNNEAISNIAVVIIGRNEGQRLVDCFKSLINQTKNIIYVDSGSTDNSIHEAKLLNIDLISLDMSIPFTAARARNIGLFHVIKNYPDVTYVQFVDGDCQVFQEWLPSAINFLDSNKHVAVVCGRRKEISPENSIYNTLCDIEWNTPIGEAKSCGGDALMRIDALKEVNGYREDLIAGEEPELCVRLRAKSWKVWRIDQNMTLHDANIIYFRQWWKRTVRSGYAYAQGANIHGAPPERHWVAESNRAILWGGLIPITVIILSLINIKLVVLFLIYPLQIFRIIIKSSLPFKTSFLYAYFLSIGKLPELIGGLKFYWHTFCRKQGNLIEYK
jgi:glycosyltransferase involved in cell wall biosynthesis